MSTTHPVITAEGRQATVIISDDGKRATINLPVDGRMLFSNLHAEDGHTFDDPQCLADSTERHLAGDDGPNIGETRWMGSQRIPLTRLQLVFYAEKAGKPKRTFGLGARYKDVPALCIAVGRYSAQVWISGRST
jgi:hypothetical protein